MRKYVVPAPDIGYIPMELLTFDMINPGAKTLYALITALVAEEGYTSEGNVSLGKKMNVTPATIHRWLAALKTFDLIKVKTVKKGMVWERTIRLSIE